MLTKANILVTGGAGTLGRAIARRRKEQDWSGRLTVYSTNPEHHQIMRRLYPDVQYIQGDIRNFETMHSAIAGHDVVIHAAAVKYIPDSEYASIDTIDVNVYGSQVVAQACIKADVEHVLAISTDKACHPANLYGATKMAMEKIWQEYSRSSFDTEFHLVRYGNVLESTGSVVEAWRNAVARGELIKITSPQMTRFWLSPRQAAQYVEESFEFDSGDIYIPKMPSLSIGRLAEYVVFVDRSDFDGFERVALRPGEKTHETLLTLEELKYVDDNFNDFYVLHPSTSLHTPEDGRPAQPYTSENAPKLTKKALMDLLDD